MRRYSILVCLFVLTCQILTLPALAQNTTPEFKEGEVLIRFQTGISAASMDRILGDLDAQVVRNFDRISVQVLSLKGTTVTEAVDRYSDDPAVAFIEPNYRCQALTVPDDPRFDDLWGMQNTGQNGGLPGSDISAVEAWSVYTGTSDVIVGVIDTGVNYNHEDLADNMWTNPGEIPGNGIDDDGNGLIDDYHGYDYVNNDGDPLDDNGHGSHCSGTIGGVGDNGIGVAGVNWDVSIMAIKFLDWSGGGWTDDAIASVEYAVMMGADVLSNSWGGGSYSSSLEAAISDANDAGIIFVAAAGNDYGNDNDVFPVYPSSYDVPNVVSVLATDNRDEVAYFSNYGATSVDLAAPGVDILSTVLYNGYDYYSGTSMATPHVAGAFALVLGRFPELGVQEAKNLIFNSVDVLPQLDGLCATGGRLNVAMAIADPDTTLPDAISDLAVTEVGGDWLEFSWTATGDDGSVGTASSYDMRYSTTGTSWDDAVEVTGEPDPQVAGSTESFRVTGLDFSTSYDFAIRAVDDYGNMGPVSNWASAVTTGPPTMVVTPSSLEETLETGQTSRQTLTISNTGSGILDFSLPEPLLVNAAKAHDFQPAAKGETDLPRGQAVVLGSGGPDAYGYLWKDSDEADGPVFDWMDISSVGAVAISYCGDCTGGPFDLGFDFNYYGNTFDQFRVCANGFISFTSTANYWWNGPLPSPAAPGNMIAPYWDDLDAYSYGGTVYYYFDGSRMIIQYDNFGRWGSGPFNFQVLLYPGGKIVFQYLTLGSYNNSCTVGIQNEDGTDGLLVAYNTEYLHEDLAIQFQSTPQWLTVSPDSGSLAPGESMDVYADFSAAELCGDAFDAEIHFLSNDPLNRDLAVPVHLDLIGYPDIAVYPLDMDFGTPFVGASVSQTLAINNLGCSLMSVSSIVSDNPAFTVDASGPFDVGIGGHQGVNVTFAPTTAGMQSGTLTITSNDLDQPEVTVNLTGTALVPPVITASPDSLSAVVAVRESVTRKLTIGNTGGSELDFSVALTSESMYKLLGPSVQFQVEEFPSAPAADKKPGNAKSVTTPKFGKRVYTEGINASDLQNILVYEEGPATRYFDAALGDMGLARTLVTTMADFSNELESTTDWDLVIVNSYQAWFSNYDLDILSNRIAMGKKTIFFAWDMFNYPDHPLLAQMGVSFLSSFDVPRNVYASDSSHPLFNDPNDLYPYQYWTDNQWGIDGSTVDVLPGSIEVAHFDYSSDSAIVINEGQNAICNTFEFMNFNGDRDYDDIQDMQELAENEIQYLIGVPSDWLIVEPTSGVVPSGGSMDLDVTFTGVDNANGINSTGPVFDSGIVITSNDVVNPTLTVPAHMTLGSGSNLMVTLTPHDTPIVVPAAGGSFTYDLKIENISTSSVKATVGIQAILPDNSGLLLTTVPVTLFPGGSIARTGLVQDVPAGAPTGMYIYKVGVGASVVEIMDLDSFTFEKSSGGVAAKSFGDWQLQGLEAGPAEKNPDPGALPTAFALDDPVPNPFNPMTRLSFALPRAANVQLDVFDLRGRLVRSLLQGRAMAAGRHEVVWQGEDNAGRAVSGGVYFYRLQAGDFSMTKRMTLVK